MNKELTLSDLFQFVLGKLRLIILLGLVAAIITFIAVKTTAVPTYTYTGSMIVNPFSDDASDLNPSYLNSEISISKSLMPTYVEVLTSSSMAQKMSDELKKSGVNVTPQNIKSMIEFTTPDKETLIIEFSCSSGNKDKAYAVAKQITKSAPEYVKTFINHGSIIVVDEVGDFSRRITNPFVMAVVAFIAAAVVVVVVTLIITILDTRVKSQEDITDRFDYPILGNIPNFYTIDKSSRRYAYEKSKQPKSDKNA